GQGSAARTQPPARRAGGAPQDRPRHERPGLPHRARLNRPPDAGRRRPRPSVYNRACVRSADRSTGTRATRWPDRWPGEERSHEPARRRRDGRHAVPAAVAPSTALGRVEGGGHEGAPPSRREPPVDRPSGRSTRPAYDEPVIDFQNASVFKLSPVPTQEGADAVAPLLIQDEQVLASFKTVRDMVVFTNKRVIAIN